MGDQQIPLTFENEFQHKYMVQEFSEPWVVDSAAKVQQWRSAWMQELGKWHSPYKLLVNVENLTVKGEDTQQALEIMLKFFSGFFLRKAAGFDSADSSKGHDLLPFPVFKSDDEARKAVGIREARPVDPSDFRGSIQIQNHFRQHVMEVGFAGQVIIDSDEKIATVKSKLTNALMQWHSKWSLLIDCTNLEVEPGTHPAWEKMFAYFRGFFMKDVIGYSPRGAKDSYPFEVFRSRHRAAAKLESEGTFSGDEANCQSRQPQKNQ